MNEFISPFRRKSINHYVTEDLIKSFPFQFDNVTIKPNTAMTDNSDGNNYIVINYHSLAVSFILSPQLVPLKDLQGAVVYRNDLDQFRINTKAHGNHELELGSAELLVNGSVKRFQIDFFENFFEIHKPHPIITKDAFKHLKKEITIYGRPEDVLTFIRFVYDGLITLNILTDHPVILLDPFTLNFPTTVLITSTVRIGDNTVKNFI